MIKINKIEQVCELDDFVNQQLKFKKAYIYSKDAIANFSKWLSKKNEEILIDFIDYYDSLDAKIQEKRKKQIKKWLNDNKSDFVRFNSLRESEITSHLDVDVIRDDYRHLYEDCLDLDWDLLDICDWELVDEFRSNYECIGAIVSYLNNRFDIKDFLGSVSGFVLGSSVGVLEKQKEDFKVFFDKCDSFVSRVSDDLLESEKVKINEFKDVYSSIDSKIYKLKVNSWLDSNRNNLIDFNNEISGEISNLVLDDDVEELKRKTEGLYNKIVEFQKYCPFLLQNGVVSSFVYNFENLEDIIADKNCKFKIKQILNEINKRNFESNSSEYLEKQKDLFSNYCVISKRIIDSFDDKITDSQKNDFLNFIEEYDNLAKEMVKREKEGNGFNFFHFMIDLTGGPCLYKRLSGCGSGTEYLAVTPWGDLYPCHQFVGMEQFKLGNVDTGIEKTDIVDEFKLCNVYAKDKCKDCFARFYCSGGCAANSYNFHGNLLDAYDIGCELERKRVECAIMIKAALA